jgi:hypothetical protein
VKRRDTGEENNKKYERSGQAWKITVACETMNRHNPFLSGEVWVLDKLDLKQPPMKMRFPLRVNSKEKFIASGKYQ